MDENSNRVTYPTTGTEVKPEAVEEAHADSMPLPEWKEEAVEWVLGIQPRRFVLPLGPDGELVSTFSRYGSKQTYFRWTQECQFASVRTFDAMKRDAAAAYLPVLDAACRVLRRIVEGAP